MEPQPDPDPPPTWARAAAPPPPGAPVSDPVTWTAAAQDGGGELGGRPPLTTEATWPSVPSPNLHPPCPKSLLGSLQILSELTHASLSAQGEGKEVSPCSCSWFLWGGE